MQALKWLAISPIVVGLMLQLFTPVLAHRGSGRIEPPPTQGYEPPPDIGSPKRTGRSGGR